MDFTQLIRDKREEYRTLRSPEGIDAVLRHLVSAEKHFQRAHSETDSDLFTDVVYRTNQVFEGILKEAYEVLADSSAGRRTPHQIEKFLETEEIFSQRVIDYFSRYRQDWRNASTHDYRLDFDEQEAFLAITTVTAFCYVAIDQMVQKLAADRASKSPGAAMQSFSVGNVQKLAGLLVTRLPKILQEMNVDPVAPALSEVLLLGAIDGLFRSSLPNVHVIQEPAFNLEGRHLRPDMLLNQNEAVVVVELKRVRMEHVPTLVHGPNFRERLASYALATKATSALGIIFPTKLNVDKIPDFARTIVEDSAIPTVIVHPNIKQATE